MNETTRAAERVVFEWAGAGAPADWIPPLLAAAALIAFSAWWTWRDCAEIGRGWAFLFSGLRAIAVVAVLVYFLQPQWRSETRITQASRTAVLVDSSQSMGLADGPDAVRRIDAAATLLAESSLLGELAAKQELDVFAFDQDLRPLAWNDAPGEPIAGEDPPLGSAADDEAAVVTVQGSATNLGDAIRNALVRENADTLAGILVLSDGQSTGGAPIEAAATLAAERGVRVFTLGFGSPQRPQGVRIISIEAPPRVFPGDGFPLRVHFQGSGVAGEEVQLRVASAPLDGQSAAAPEASARDVLGAEEQATVVAVDLPGRDEPGTRRYEIEAAVVGRPRLAAAATVDVEIVDRQTQVLLIAGGPTREYRFLRNQLQRDREFEVDVWLQKADAGISQDARRILFEFPRSAEDLFEYDAILCFDADWREVDEEQIALLERWTAEQAGGLVLVAGPIYMDRWLYDDRFRLLRDLHPVVFQRRFTQFIDARYGFEEPRGLEPTREGRESALLQLGAADGSSDAWRRFAGVYGYFEVNEAKPGAGVLLRSIDPHGFGDRGGPIFLAEQFYGAGRTVFLASGEMWRLRGLQPEYFETFYTNLIRHVAQGRLLRGSKRGSLFTADERFVVGDSVLVRAQLFDRQMAPLAAESVPLQIVAPGGGRSIDLQATGDRPGFFEGRFNAMREGEYELLLDVPDGDGERLARRLDVRVPDVERRRPEQNVDALRQLAEATGGRYYAAPAEAFGGGPTSIASLLPDMTRESYLSGAVDRERERTLRTWLLSAFCTALCLEWLLRRIKRLA